MRIRITTESEVSRRKARRLKKVLRRALSILQQGKSLEVSVALVGEEQMRKLNREYRGIDESTDVLAFPQISPEEIDLFSSGDRSRLEPLGDIIICLPEARRQAKEIGQPEVDELELLSVHGLLHLLGYDDVTEEGELSMKMMENKLLGRNIDMKRRGAH